jgi:hypothetical protein
MERKGINLMEFKISRLVAALLVEAIVLCLILSLSFISISATVTLLIFNLFFLSLIIHLNGTLNSKLGILALGNITGLLWNLVLYYFATAGASFFGEPFNRLYAVSYPFLNFMWVVSFWSLSLTVFPKPKKTREETKKIDY